ncbi:hypothetical protein CANARDRAFT_5187 [[Candida] arabinofermentans NRRL YB-2248]|uniref:Ribosomal protein S21 n=1 Tax=[Candida] arabinofermentans NRRL YB-2248 TaxID=983967 RepID=A0A1E4T7Y6_9ASCO|nr:hypothetical protein CANARDRAFT_5187 [[Candida] arabinofermentans NRRL YB-2248]
MLRIISNSVVSFRSSLSRSAIPAQTFRFQSSTPNKPGMEPFDILAALGKPGSSTRADALKQSFDPFSGTGSSSFLGESSSSLRATQLEPSAFEYATKFPLFSKQAGRTIIVKKGSYNRAYNQFESFVRANNLKTLYHEQRFYLKPNKVRLNRKLAVEKKRFDEGIAKLFKVVKDAVRKGY